MGDGATLLAVIQREDCAISRHVYNVTHRIQRDALPVETEDSAALGFPFRRQRHVVGQIVAAGRIGQRSRLCPRFHFVVVMLTVLLRHKRRCVQRRAYLLIVRHIQPCCLLLAQFCQSLINSHQLCLKLVRILRCDLLRQGVDQRLRRLHRRILVGSILVGSISPTDVFTGGGDVGGVPATLCLLFRHCTCPFRKCRHGHHGKAEHKCQEQTQYPFLHKISIPFCNLHTFPHLSIVNFSYRLLKCIILKCIVQAPT